MSIDAGLVGDARVYVGLMSGTSLDGISAAVVRFAGDQGVELLAFRQLPYSAARRARLAAALEGVPPDEYCRLGFDLGHWLADAAVAVLADAGVSRQDVAAIASHGQTLWHVPGHSTWQFGESAVIAERTGIDVVSDFRVRDVAAGGQGAPLVPIADAMLFSSPTGWRALQNLGGIGNVTVVPPLGELLGVRAFDTGPGVVVIDAVTREVTGARFDAGGALARQGTAVHGAVKEALAHPYFAATPPKSTGRELFTARWIADFLASCRRHAPEATAADLVATAVELTAASVTDAFRRFIPEPVTELLVSGGGAENPALVDAIGRNLGQVSVRRFSEVFFHGEAKEAVAFALLGRLFLERAAGNIVGVTGARGPRVLGKLTPGEGRNAGS
jgi:anhydro-N-acetylmuramic acid kinase